MTHPDELEPLACIIITINIYRHEAGDYKEPVNRETVEAYSDQHPSIPAWLIQRRLEVSERTSLVNPFYN